MPRTTGKITQADIEAYFVRIQKAHEETEKALRESIEDTKALKESTKELKESTTELKESTKELRKSIEETNKRLNESIEEANKKLNESINKTSRKIYKSIGGLTKTLGKMSVSTLVPSLVEKFKQLGFTFEKMSCRQKIISVDHDIRTEIDAFLENTTQAMAVEVKTTLRQEEVDWHVERMEKIRRHADLHNDKRQFFGAMAATVVDDNMRIYALSKGFYIIEPSGDDVGIVEPGAVKIW